MQTLSGRVTTAESDIDDIEAVIPSNASSSNKLATANDIPDTSSFATASDLQTLSGRVTTAESDIDDIEAVIPSNASSSNKLATANDIPDTSSFATASDLQTLSGRVTTAESDIDDIEALIPSNASSSNKLATANDIQTITNTNRVEQFYLQLQSNSTITVGNVTYPAWTETAIKNAILSNFNVTAQSVYTVARWSNNEFVPFTKVGTNYYSDALTTNPTTANMFVTARLQ